MCSPPPCPGSWRASGNSTRRGRPWPPYQHESQCPACRPCTARHSLSRAPSAKCRMFQAVCLHGPGRASWPYRNISCRPFGRPGPSYGVAPLLVSPGRMTRSNCTRSTASSRDGRAACSRGRRSSAADRRRPGQVLEGEEEDHPKTSTHFYKFRLLK